MNKAKLIFGVCAYIFVQATVIHAENVNPVFEVPPGVTFLTGDSWDQGGTIVRLYGVQSCIRGTPMKANAQNRDCGDISMAFLAKFIASAPTSCQGIAQTQSPPQYLVVCKSKIGDSVVDLGTALIVKGFAFASEDARGDPVNIQYYVAEQEAKAAKSGLWQFDGFPHPNLIMKGAIEKQIMK